MIDAIQASVIILILALVIALGRLLSPFVTRVFNRTPSHLDRVLNPVENWIYRLCGVNPNRSMDWKEYFLSLVLLNVLQMALAFLVLVFQDRLPLNPQGFPGLTWDLTFNTVISFGTNTNLQHYAGESTLSYLSNDGNSVSTIHLGRLRSLCRDSNDTWF